VNDIVRELNVILGTRIEPIYEPARPGEVQRIYLDASRAAKSLGWKPRTSFRDGLKQTVEWSRSARS
jgi:UDP-glucose 4-epimerase